MTVRGVAEVAAARSAIREALVSSGFEDNGEVLRGHIEWQLPADTVATATVDVTITDAFPFGPPAVRHVDGGIAPFEPTFHIETDGTLCLWDPSDAGGEIAPWLDPVALIERVAGWYERTHAGWPGDEDCDLERYVIAGAADGILLYDGNYVRSRVGETIHTSVDGQIVTVDQVSASRTRPKPRPKPGRKVKPAPPGAWQRNVLIVDVGAVDRPLRCWDDLASLLGDRTDVERSVATGRLHHVLVFYSRGGREGTLGLDLSVDKGEITIKSREVADTSTTARTLRSGPTASSLSDVSVAVVGCGAVGSYVVDLLYRQGVRTMSLYDGERYRPGNAVRHAADADLVGLDKVDALHRTLKRLDLDDEGISTRTRRITTGDQAREVFRNHDLVVDATGNDRTTGLLMWAAEVVGKPLVTACVQRDGGIARADRLPLSGNEHHAAPVPVLAGAAGGLVERGCGDLVSPTAPSAVVVAATLAVELAVDGLTKASTLPPTLLRVLEPQPDDPYRQVGLITGTHP